MGKDEIPIEWGGYEIKRVIERDGMYVCEENLTQISSYFSCASFAGLFLRNKKLANSPLYKVIESLVVPSRYELVGLCFKASKVVKEHSDGLEDGYILKLNHTEYKVSVDDSCLCINVGRQHVWLGRELIDWIAKVSQCMHLPAGGGNEAAAIARELHEKCGYKIRSKAHKPEEEKEGEPEWVDLLQEPSPRM